MRSGKRRRELYDSLVRSHVGDLFRFAFRLCGQEETAEDLVQETFLEAWRSIHSLRREESARPWLFQILRHRYMHWLRDNNRRVRPDVSLEQLGERALPGVADEARTLTWRDLLQKALDTLDDRFKVPFLMVFLEGLTCKQTAMRLNLPLGTVLSRIHRARSILREFLGSLETDEEAPGGVKAGKPVLKIVDSESKVQRNRERG